MDQHHKAFSSVRSSAVDGRLHNALLRKEKLQALHKALVDDASQIMKSMSSAFSSKVEAETQIEFGLALECITNSYTSIDTDRLLVEEYAIAKGTNSSNCREPIGIVVIEPSEYALLHSLICALAPAVAAGNCIIVQVQQDLNDIFGLLLEKIRGSLGDDICAITTRHASEEDVAHRHVRVLQNGCSTTKLYNYIVSSHEAPAVAFVERDADIDAAATALAAAQLCCGGSAPYAAKLVLVNEWVKDEFKKAVEKAFASVSQDQPSTSWSESLRQDNFAKDKESIDTLAKTLAHEKSAWEVLDRSSFLTRAKMDQPRLLFHSCTSVDDAIDLCNDLGRLPAAYVFTSPKMAKYFCQFVNAEVCFVNNVPRRLLYGPIAPEGYPPMNGSQSLYDSMLFTLPRPVYIKFQEHETVFQHTLNLLSNQDITAFVNKKSANLPNLNRPRKVVLMGFFEQGIVTGLTLALGSIACGTWVIGYYAWQYFR